MAWCQAILISIDLASYEIFRAEIASFVTRYSKKKRFLKAMLHASGFSNNCCCFLVPEINDLGVVKEFSVVVIASTRLQARSACNSKLRRSFERAGALW